MAVEISDSSDSSSRSSSCSEVDISSECNEHDADDETIRYDYESSHGQNRDSDEETAPTDNRATKSTLLAPPLWGELLTDIVEVEEEGGYDVEKPAVTTPDSNMKCSDESFSYS